MNVYSDGGAVIEARCLCGTMASTHHDASASLAFCQSCNCATCQDCRDDSGNFCKPCAKVRSDPSLRRIHRFFKALSPCPLYRDEHSEPEAFSSWDFPNCTCGKRECSECGEDPAAYAGSPTR